jgi:hypothetical protein
MSIWHFSISFSYPSASAYNPKSFATWFLTTIERARNNSLLALWVILVMVVFVSLGSLTVTSCAFDSTSSLTIGTNGNSTTVPWLPFSTFSFFNTLEDLVSVMLVSNEGVPPNQTQRGMLILSWQSRIFVVHVRRRRRS